MATECLLIAVNFNFHVNIPTDMDSVKFLDLLHSMGLCQHVTFPIHVSGNTLDLLITRETDLVLGQPPCTKSLFF
jgi:hypothetical protein